MGVRKCRNVEYWSKKKNGDEKTTMIDVVLKTLIRNEQHTGSVYNYMVENSRKEEKI